LRSLKKGTARLAFSAWEEGIDLTVLPVGINYSSFDTIGKNIHVNFGNPFTWKDLDHAPANGHSILAFNAILKKEMTALVYDMASDDHAALQQTFRNPSNSSISKWLHIPAFIGKYLHAPLYLPLQSFFKKRFLHTGFYDSLMIASLMLLYPIYLFLIAILLWLCFGIIYAAIPFLLFPLLAWCFIKVKHPFSRK